MTNQRQVLPTITLSADTRACLDELEKPIPSPFDSSRETSDFLIGTPKPITQINKPVATEIIGKALTGLLRIKGFDCECIFLKLNQNKPNEIFSFRTIKHGKDCTESSLQMFKDAVDGFYICFMEAINQVVVADNASTNVRHLIYELHDIHTGKG